MDCVIGIDVGGPAKGFHGVAVKGHAVIAKITSCSAADVGIWCRKHKAAVVAVDAPCRWRMDRARLAERELARDRISCFSTPTQAQAQGHPFFTWMLAGAELYSVLLANGFPIYEGCSRRESVAIETFPQAAACALAGEIVSAKRKKDVRSELLRLAGFDPSAYANIDELDAALCALTAQRFLENDFKAYGDAVGGFIVVPKTPVTGFVGENFPPKPATAAATEKSVANPGEPRPPPRQGSVPIFGKELSWSSFIGLFLINFGHLEFLVSAYLETQLAPAAFAAMKTRPFQERMAAASALLASNPDKRAAYEKLQAPLEAARQFRNHLAHGYLASVFSREGSNFDMGLIQAKDISNELSPETRRLSFSELEQQVVAICQVIEGFSDLTGSREGEGVRGSR